ncbi:MAG: alpha/beta fold hydrolase [Acidobacteriota bacterium]
MPTSPAYSAPSRWATFLEVRASWEALGLLGRLSDLRKAPRGDGRPLMLVPGFWADGYSMVPLRAFLRRLGYRVFDWGLGRNRGEVEEDIVALGGRVDEVFSVEGEPLTLIGWSLGGVLCREVARLQPDQVREVITFGTPVVGGPKYTALADWIVKRRQIDLPALEADILRRNRLGFKQPVTSVYSKADGIVGWTASLDTFNPQARNIEVKGSHLGFGVNPRVWLLIAETLASSPRSAAMSEAAAYGGPGGVGGGATARRCAGR